MRCCPIPSDRLQLIFEGFLFFLEGMVLKGIGLESCAINGRPLLCL